MPNWEVLVTVSIQWGSLQTVTEWACRSDSTFNRGSQGFMVTRGQPLAPHFHHLGICRGKKCHTEICRSSD